MQPWWWRSVAACASVLVLAGLVAVIAGAVGADRATALRAAGEDVAAVEQPSPAAATPTAPGPAPGPAPDAAEPDRGPDRVPDAVTATTVAVLPGWRVVPTQDVVEIPAGRFEDATILRRGADAVVLVGVADPARVPSQPEPRPSAALDAEARRLADAYVEQLAPGADTAALTDDGEEIADLPTRTSVRRIEGGALDGALVRVSTIAAPGRTLAVLAVVRPSPTVGADGDAADAVVRSLRLDPA
ncbi:hypothetical protein ACFPK1_18355 [Actinomycetospora rhizophila]|uniref:SAF domain-containing protein n=1 Tax=Actinomycetospora rhizophila TaxID=1416876 RepID=A0ABV9ZFM9_9PSEU